MTAILGVNNQIKKTRLRTSLGLEIRNIHGTSYESRRETSRQIDSPPPPLRYSIPLTLRPVPEYIPAILAYGRRFVAWCQS